MTWVVRETCDCFRKRPHEVSSIWTKELDGVEGRLRRSNGRKRKDR